MVLGMRKLSKRTYKELKFQMKKYQIENTSLNIDDMYDQYEQELTYLGIVGIEDTLREQVPETMCMMRDAGISVWICSGDKYETTMGVAKQCKFIDSRARELALIDQSAE